jgi:ribose transport system permease protein
MLIVMGGMDISVGSIVALAGVCVGVLYESLGVPGAVACALLIGLAFGLLNGFTISFLKVPPLIATIASMSMARGLAYVVNDGATAKMPDKAFATLYRGDYLGFDNFILFLAIAVGAVFVIMRYTTFGRSLYAIGGNETASKFAGIKVRRIKFFAYIISGLVAAACGLLQTSQMMAGAPQAGLGLEMSAISAVILGGASLSGGKGNPIGTLLGVLLIGLIKNGLLLNSISTDWENIITGAIMLFAIALDVMRQRNKGEL